MVRIQVHIKALQKAAPLPSNWPTYLKEIEVPQKLLVSLGQDTAFHIDNSRCTWSCSLEAVFSRRLDAPPFLSTRRLVPDKSLDTRRIRCRDPSPQRHCCLESLVALADLTVPRWRPLRLSQFSCVSSENLDQWASNHPKSNSACS